MDDTTVELLLLIEREHQGWRKREAVGWVVVCVDVEEGLTVETDGFEVAFCSGVYGDELEATVAAARMDAEDVRLDETGWRHIVAPVFAKERP